MIDTRRLWKYFQIGLVEGIVVFVIIFFLRMS